MAEVSGLRNRNHFDSNCSRDRDEGKSATLDGRWADGEPPVAVGGRLGVFIHLFSLKFRRLCVERSVFSVSRIHLFSVAAPWCPAHQHPRYRNLLPPRNVSSSAWRQNKTRVGRYSRVCGSSPPSCFCASGSYPDTCRLRPPLSPAWRSCELPLFKPPVAPRRPALNFESVRGTAALLPLPTLTHTSLS